MYVYIIDAATEYTTYSFRIRTHSTTYHTYSIIVCIHYTYMLYVTLVLISFAGRFESVVYVRDAFVFRQTGRDYIYVLAVWIQSVFERPEHRIAIYSTISSSTSFGVLVYYFVRKRSPADSGQCKQ